MTEISKEKLEELKNIYKSSFGIELSEDEALDIGLSILQLVTNILPSNKDNIGKY